MDTSDLAKRMKNYEAVSKSSLMRRCPVAMRLDGKSFHTFTRGFIRPFDFVLQKVMQETMKYLCENIQGCVLGYTQSDEITLILIDYQKLTTSAWFDYEVQKMCSIAASMATMAFNKFFAKNVDSFIWKFEKAKRHFYEGYYFDDEITDEEKKKIINENNEIFCNNGKYLSIYKNAVDKGAMFDARCFNIPKEEVTNLVYWRQLDATRNSIQMVGQANFSHRELQNKSCNDIQDMLMLQKAINWNDLPTTCKRGSCCKKVVVGEPDGANFRAREQWIIDNEIPLFKGDGRDYIDSLVYVGE
jgi:tRNA(His) 5'-end guanylyltransferase